MTWHHEHKREPGVLSHPFDGEAWKKFDQIHAPFAAEPRNVRLGLCIDGFTPFGMSSTLYSCWPVIVTPYNLPPWMCMKIPYMFLTLIIPGPYSPKNNIDVFLQPLIDELYVLWKDGIDTYDAFRERNFNLKVALMWTINDFLAYGMLSGWSTHGRISCPYCMEKSKAFHLKHGRKTSFFYSHRQFLPKDHPFRRNKDYFTRGRVENDTPPPRLSGLETWRRVHKYPKQKELGRDLTAAELFFQTHVKKDKKTFVDNEAKETWEQYMEKYGDEDSHDKKSGKIANTYIRWADHVGSKKGKFYGLPSGFDRDEISRNIDEGRQTVIS
nr:hypothetical protein [Tanacetum cinerariifolium]